MMKDYNEFISENLTSETLVVVDVQKEFSKWIPQGMLEKMNEYCEDFNDVYQIWDSNDASEPSYVFPNQRSIYEKKFGTTYSTELHKTTEMLLKKYPDLEEGKIIKLKNLDGVLVRVKNNHKWFYVNKKLTELYELLKGKKVILIGGADNECLEDVYESMESFGIRPIYNHEYIYSSKTSNKQTVS